MSHTVVLALGGLACGFAAGAAAQFGRLCTFAAIEDALVARDRRRARAWLLAIVVAVAGTQLLVTAGLLDPTALPYGGPTLAVGGLLIGGLLFGFGMALVGTCTFGLLVRLGAGDLRALVSLLVVGITAFAATAGALADVRLALAASLTFDLGGSGGATLLGPIRLWAGPTGGLGFLLLLIGINIVTGDPGKAAKDLVVAAQSSELGAAKSVYRQIVIPFAMPLLVGPGVIANLILYGSEAEARHDPELSLGLIFVTIGIAVVTLLILISGRVLRRLLGDVGLSILTRILGLLVASIGMQFVITGLTNVIVNTIAPAVLKLQ